MHQCSIAPWCCNRWTGCNRWIPPAVVAALERPCKPKTSPAIDASMQRRVARDVVLGRKVVAGCCDCAIGGVMMGLSQRHLLPRARRFIEAPDAARRTSLILYAMGSCEVAGTSNGTGGDSIDEGWRCELSCVARGEESEGNRRSPQNELTHRTFTRGR